MLPFSQVFLFLRFLILSNGSLLLRLSRSFRTVFSSFSDYRIPFESFSPLFQFVSSISSGSPLSQTLWSFSSGSLETLIFCSPSPFLCLKLSCPFQIGKRPKTTISGEREHRQGRSQTDPKRPPGRKKARNRRKRKRSLGREGVRDLRGRGNLFRGSHDQKSHPERPAARLPKPPAPQNPKAPIETQVSSGWES